MREYLIVHTHDTSIWTSVTIDAADTHALLVHGDDNIVSTVPFQTADELVQYCTQSPDFLVREVGLYA